MAVSVPSDDNNDDDDDDDDNNDMSFRRQAIFYSFGWSRDTAVMLLFRLLRVKRRPHTVFTR